MTLLPIFEARDVDCAKAWAVEMVKVYGVKWSVVGPVVLKIAKAVANRDAVLFGEATDAMERIEDAVVPR